MRILVQQQQTSQTMIVRWMTLYLTILSIIKSTSVNAQSDYDYGNDSSSSSYQDYTDPYTQPDNLYADYAATKMEGGMNKGGG
jgi:hypothetical protein